MHGIVTRITSFLLVALGVAILVSTIGGGGGPLSIGVVLGLLFVGAGAGRIWISREGPGREAGG